MINSMDTPPSSDHGASLVPGIVAARRDEGIPDVEVQRGLIPREREAIEMSADAAREVLGAHLLHALRDGVQVDLRPVEHGRQAEPVGDPQDVTPALRHRRLCQVVPVQALAGKPAGQRPAPRAPAVPAVTTVVAAASTRRPTAAHCFVRVHCMVLSFQTKGAPSALGCNCRIHNPFRSEHALRYIPGC